jgi:hypothetical protein
MNENVDLGAIQDLLTSFRRDEVAIHPAYHSPHGNAEAWRLSEDMHTHSMNN